MRWNLKKNVDENCATSARDHRRKLELASVNVPRHCGFPFAGVEPKQGGNPPAWGVCHCNHRVCSACLVACAPHGYNQANPWRLPDKDFYWTKFQRETGIESVWKQISLNLCLVHLKTWRPIWPRYHGPASPRVCMYHIDSLQWTQAAGIWDAKTHENSKHLL